jgi:hypothetical protein
MFILIEMFTSLRIKIISKYMPIEHQLHQYPDTFSVTHNQVTGTVRCYRHLRLIVIDLSYCNQIHDSFYMLASTFCRYISHYHSYI